MRGWVTHTSHLSNPRRLTVCDLEVQSRLIVSESGRVYVTLLPSTLGGLTRSPQNILCFPGRMVRDGLCLWVSESDSVDDDGHHGRSQTSGRRSRKARLLARCPRTIHGSAPVTASCLDAFLPPARSESEPITDEIVTVQCFGPEGTRNEWHASTPESEPLPL